MVEQSQSHSGFRPARRPTWWSTAEVAVVIAYLPILLILMQSPGSGSSDDNFIPLLMVAGSLVILLWSWSAVPRAAMTIVMSRPLGWVLLYMAYLALVTTFSETFIIKTSLDKVRELSMLGVYLSPGIAIFVLIQRPQRMRPVLWGLRVLGWIVLGTFVYGLAFGIGSETASVSRVFGVYGDSIAWAASFFLILSLAYGRWLEFGAFVLMIALSGSMGAAIAAAASIIFHVLLLVARKRLNVLYILGAVLLVLVAIQFVDLSNVPVFQRLFSEDQKAFSLNARFGSFSAAFDIFQDHPVFGVGFGGFFEAALNYDVERYFEGGFSANYISNAQNQYLQTLTEGGVPALIIFITVLCSAMVWLFRLERHEDPHAKPFMSAAFAWVASIAVTNQTAVWLMPHSVNTVIFAVIIGIVSARRQLLATRLFYR